MAKKLIQEYVFNPGRGLMGNNRPNATHLINVNKAFIVNEMIAFIQNKVTANDADYLGITYNYTRITSEFNTLVDEVVFDLQYTGNEGTRSFAQGYWDKTVPTIPGNRIAEREAIEHFKTLLPYILGNTDASSIAEQSVATQVIDTDYTSENLSDTAASQLLTQVQSVLQNGLTSLPELIIGLGRIEVLGKIQLEDILIITNVTDNIVIYNFADDAKGGTVEFNQGNSPDYPRASAVNEGTTILHFYYDTSSMSIDDNIQIFFEESELKVRLADISMDAMERVKIGKPQAMLDADFEYGLQPTKWQAIATQRGYPSVYEIPASDIEVLTVTTDASSSTNGVGASLITVTTVTPHEFQAGDPFTIRALSSSVLGFNRAEGSFIVNTIVDSTSFTYYGKSKVGSLTGAVLATSNTQLRRGGFYTGSSISNATFSIPQQGGSGSFTTTLQAPSNTGFLTFTGTPPTTGLILSGTGVDTGTQVNGVFGSATNGVEATKYVANDFTSGDSSITVTDATGIAQGMALTNAAVTPQQLIITSIVGNTLNLNGPITTNYTGDAQEYTGLITSSSNYLQGSGTNATFDVTIDANLDYSVTIAAGGSNYEIGDTLLIAGTALGGVSPTNDIILNVDGVGPGNTSVSSVEIISTSSGASQTTYSGVASSQTTNTFATNSNLTLERDGGTYQFVSSAGGSNFKVGNKFTISGGNLGGTSPTNDAVVQVEAETNGTPTDYSIVSGSAIRGDQISIYTTISISTNTTQIVPASTSITTAGIARVRVVFADSHGLYPGSAITVTQTSGDGSNNHSLAAGPFFVQEVVNDTTIEYDARADGTIDITNNDDIKGQVYVRPDAFFTHRPYDGGVQLGTGSPQHGNQAIRMSKKYIRYQSGKGAMYNTGALFAPSFDISSMTADGTSVGSIITIETDDQDHGLQSGAVVRISGSETVGYNTDLTVTEIVNERSFKATSPNILGSTTATLGSQCQMSLLYWHGAAVRSGCYDDQNGIFWQYDGENMAVCRRTATFQCAGSITVASGSNTITGDGTRFLDQLQEGDRIVLKGMTHVVANISSNTAMTINPGFRGVSDVSFAKITKVQDIIIPQSDWNLDKCDGTGPSGYQIDVTKMQMIGIQFTWYGAGFIDWMLRGPDGNYIFCHREKGNNVNTEAYMRTGNLPVRYEVINEGARTRLSVNHTDAESVLSVDSLTGFPESGVVQVGQELISYTGKTTTAGQPQLTGCTRATTLSNFAGGSTRSYLGGAASSYNARTGVVLISGSTSPIISHWGSAYLIDGEFDNDRGYIFSYPENNIEVSTTRQTAFLLRLAPSVSNAIIGDLGERELLNRAQLLLQGIEITSDGTDSSNNEIKGGIVVEGVLNPKNYPVSVSDITWSGLSTQAQGGQPSFAQVASGGSVNWSSGATQTETDIDWQGNVSTASTVSNLYEVDADGGSRDNYVYLSAADILSQGIQVGMICTTVPFNGARIVSIGPDFFGREVLFDRDATNEGTKYGFGTLNLSFEFNTERTNSSVAFFDQTSWESSGATTGTAISTNDANWPAGTVVSSVTQRSIGSTTFYEVTFNNASNKGVTLNGTLPDTVTMLFGQPPYALPGETVFSFVAQPGERANLDLSELKELTTTTLGGRGTFPNGPDVLAINVFKVAGTATNANILLRWGEAQA